MRALDQAPSLKDLDIEKRFRELKTFNEGRNNDDDDDDDDNNNTGPSPGGNLTPLQYPSSSLPPSLPPTLPISSATPLNATQRFLFRLQKVAEVIGQELTATRPQKITLLDKI